MTGCACAGCVRLTIGCFRFAWEGERWRIDKDMEGEEGREDVGGGGEVAGELQVGDRVKD